MAAVRPAQRVAERSDAPRMAITKRGSFAGAAAAGATSQSREAVLARLERDMHAQSSLAPRCSLLNTWARLHGTWFNGELAQGEPGVPVLPPTVMKIFWR